MNWLVLALALVFAVAAPVDAQDRPAAGINREQGAPGSAGPKADGVVQRGQQPNAAEVRPGNRDGDAPSASAGEMVARQQQTRIFGLPVTAALLLGGVLITLLVVAAVAIPAARRRERPQGGGTYGRR